MNAKRLSWFIAGTMLISLSIAGRAQTVIENPAKPKAAGAGRVVGPEEVLAISDEGTDDYYFKWPRALRAAPGGSLLLTDEDQVLEFDGKGQFVRNLFKWVVSSPAGGAVPLRGQSPVM